jgi:hypothetical protein
MGKLLIKQVEPLILSFSHRACLQANIFELPARQGVLAGRRDTQIGAIAPNIIGPDQ